MAPEKPDGFTLLELVVSLTILGVIITLIYGGMRIGVRAWEKGESSIENQQRSRIVLDRIGQQLASMAFPVDLPAADAAKYLLKGDAGSLEFISRAALMPENRRGLVHVLYEIRTSGEEGHALLVAEQNLAFRPKEASEVGVEEEDLHVLIPHAADIRFEYFKQSEMDDAQAGRKTAPGIRSVGKAPPRSDRQRSPVDPGEENVFLREAEWDPEVELFNPVAVGVSIRMDDASDPIRIVVPLPGEDRP